MVTEYPLDFKRKPKDEQAIPFPSDDTTPPVKNMYFVFFFIPIFTRIIFYLVTD